MQSLLFRCEDGQSLSVPTNIVGKWNTIVGMMDIFAGSQDTPIDVPILSDVFLEIVNFTSVHFDDVPPAVETPPHLLKVDDRDRKYMDTSFDVLLEYSQAAGWLDYYEFLKTSCLVLARKMDGFTTQQIRDALHIENDFTPEEEEQIRKESEWYQS
jgi:S-phase kinase-associated protein 1